MTLFEEYFQQFNMIRISMTLLMMIVWILLLILKLYTVHHILYKNSDLTIRVRVLTILCAFSFQSYISLLIISMIFYELKMMRKYRYSMGASYILLIIGKQFMYILFLETLVKTFKRSLFEISSTIHKCILTLIILNFIIYIIMICFWMKPLLLLCSIPIEMFYSLFIVALFGKNLFMLNLARINEHKSQKYEKRVRSATLDAVNEHKEKLKLQRSLSLSDTMQTEHEHESVKSLPLSMIHLASLSRTHSVDTVNTTPNLKQHKSINIHRFNKENKELLDQHQLSVIDTSSKHTVLSSVAFLTSLQSTLLIGLSQSKMDCNFMLYIVVFNVIIGDLCVLLRLNDTVLMQIYGVLCCAFSVCCKHCFLYCSIRHVMTKIEDELTQKIEKECDMRMHNDVEIITKQNESKETKKCSQLTLKPRSLQKLQSISMSSQLSASVTPNTPGNKTPSYFYEHDMHIKNDNIISDIPKLNITVTSPNNKDTVFRRKDAIRADQDEDGCSDSEDMDKDIVFITETHVYTQPNEAASVVVILSNEEHH